MSRTTAFLGLFAGFLLIATGKPPCPIELNPPSVVLKYGDPISINCSTSETDFQQLGWEVPVGAREPAKVNHSTWSVEELTEWDIYVACFINLEPGSPVEQCEQKAVITVYSFTEHVSINSTGPDGVMRENTTHKFECDVGPVAPVQNLTVRFYREDTLIHANTYNYLTHKKPLSILSAFDFTPTRLDNGVRFRCEAHIDLTPLGPLFNLASQEYNITVQYGPDVPRNCSGYNMNIREGQTLASHCPVEGNPPPDVRWMKDGHEIDPRIPLKRGDAGVYTIEAEGASSLKLERNVFVLYRPELDCPSSYTAVEHVPHSLRCNVSGYPEPEVIWYKDDEEVGVVLPEYFTRHDEGQYTITASNSNFAVNATVDITVTYAPSKIVELEDAEVEAGSDVYLKCSSTGNPRPQYVWSYYRMANVELEAEDGVSRLLIRNATALNAGSYTCNATNDRGSSSHTVRVTVRGAPQECPIKITPDRMVVPYKGKAGDVACTPSGNDSNLERQHWQDGGNIKDVATWVVNTFEDWESQPVCIAEFTGFGKCNKSLDFILYKTPDSVSIRAVRNLTEVGKEMTEGERVQLHCDVVNVAPADKVRVKWFIEHVNGTVAPLINGSTQVKDCLPENSSDCKLGARSLMSVTSTISIDMNRAHNGTKFSCVAQLDLGTESPGENTSITLDVTVRYAPVINKTKLPKEIPLFRGYPEELVCEAEGHPPPVIRWYGLESENGVLKVTEPGFYNCTATNEVGTASHVVEVIFKEDYLPLIAGFVALTVICISVVFCFIYSIYYKNTKMRRYSLKNPKLSTHHNGNVAHNGWDLQFPMTKLS